MYIMISEMTEVKSSPAVKKMKLFLIIYMQLLEYSSSIQTFPPGLLLTNPLYHTVPPAITLWEVKRQETGGAANKTRQQQFQGMFPLVSKMHRLACVLCSLQPTHPYRLLTMSLSAVYTLSFACLTCCSCLSVLCQQWFGERSKQTLAGKKGKEGTK